MKRGGGGDKKVKENRSKQTRPTLKVAKLLTVGYANRDFKHNATNAGHFYGYVTAAAGEVFLDNWLS